MTKLNHFSKPMLFLFSSQWCQRLLFKNIRFLEKKHQITSKLQNQCNKFPTETFMLARRHGDHFGAVPPNHFLCPPKREMCPPSESCTPKESNRTDATGEHLRRRPFFHFFLSSPQNFAQNAYQRRLLCAQARVCPPNKIVSQKKATEPTPLGYICDKDFFLVFILEYIFVPPPKLFMP